MPLDLIPDAIPIIGQADDITVLLLVLDLFIANAPEAVREEQIERAHNGTAQLDQDLARLRELLGTRFDQIRDRLPELLERYGDLRDSRAVKAMLRDWRARRLRGAASAPATEDQAVRRRERRASAGTQLTPLEKERERR